MIEAIIADFIQGINNVLIPPGHLLLWIDKFHLCQGFNYWFNGTQLEDVDLIFRIRKELGWDIEVGV